MLYLNFGVMIEPVSIKSRASAEAHYTYQSKYLRDIISCHNTLKKSIACVAKYCSAAAKSVNGSHRLVGLYIGFDSSYK